MRTELPEVPACGDRLSGSEMVKWAKEKWERAESNSVKAARQTSETNYLPFTVMFVVINFSLAEETVFQDVKLADG